jgi:hypothetical protein
LEQLAALAAAGGSEGRAVQKEATEPLTQLLAAAPRPVAEREDAALVLALIGAEEPLRQCLADTRAPVALRRRAAESLGLLAKRSGDPKQRKAIATELEKWLRSEALDVLIEVEFDPAKLDPAEVQGLVEETQRQVAEGMQQMIQAGQLSPELGQDQLQEIFKQNINRIVVEQLQKKLWAEGKASGWAEHDALLPLLQGASRGLQLAASADLPLFASGPGLVVPMLTLTALEEGSGLRIRTEVVEVPLWRLPLPGGEQLELVLVPAGPSQLGSPATEHHRQSVMDWFAARVASKSSPAAWSHCPGIARTHLSPGWIGSERSRIGALRAQECNFQAALGSPPTATAAEAWMWKRCGRCGLRRLRWCVSRSARGSGGQWWRQWAPASASWKLHPARPIWRVCGSGTASQASCRVTPSAGTRVGDG